MAHTGSFVKLLRQLSAAKDSYRSGAMDFEWEEGKATIYLVFGQPNHAVYDGEDGTHLEGQPALAELAMRLPSQFQISNWRKEVVRNETLECTMEELIAPFALLAGTKSDDVPDRATDGTSQDPLYSEIPQGPKIPLEDFPLLPVGPSMWADADAHVVHLDVLTPKLPPSLVVLTAPKLKAVAIVVHGTMIDALWVDEDDTFYGEAAGMAMIGAGKGSLSGYKMPDEETAEAISLLWRTPVSHALLDSSWLRADKMLAGIESSMRNTVISITTKTDRCVAVISMGKLMGTWSGKDRTIKTTSESLVEILSEPGTVTIMQGADVKASGPSVDAMVHQYVADPSAPPAAEPTPPAGKAASSGGSRKKVSGKSSPEKAKDAEVDYLAQAAATPAEPTTPAEAPAAWLSGPAAQPAAQTSEQPTGNAGAGAALPDENQTAPAGEEDSALSRPEPPQAETELEIHDTGLAEPHTGEPQSPPDADAAPVMEEPVGAGETDDGTNGMPEAAGSDSDAFPDGGEPGPREDAEGESQPLPNPGEAIWLAQAAEPDSANLAAAQNWAEEDGSFDAVTAISPPATPEAQASEEAAGPDATAAPDPADSDQGTSPPIYVDFGQTSDYSGEEGPAESAGMTDDIEDEGNPDIDTKAIKADLIQIGVRWLGQDSAGDIIAMIEATGSEVDEFVGTIDRIRNATVPGYDPSVIRSMAREMHYYAAEALCGA